MDAELEFELAQALTYNFFDGRYYITFDNEEDCEQFLTFLQMYDLRKFPQSTIDEIKRRAKSVAWLYSKIIYHHQMEWAEDTMYFHKKDIDYYPMEYKKVKSYVEKMLWAKEILMDNKGEE